MRGHPLGGPDKRLRIDFADLDVVPGARRDYEHIDSKHTVCLFIKNSPNKASKVTI